MDKRCKTEGFVQVITIAILTSILLLVSLGYWGFRQYLNYKNQMTENEKLSQELEKVNTEKEITSKNSQIQELKKTVDDLKKEKTITPPLLKISPVLSPKETSNALSRQAIQSRLEQLALSVVRIECPSLLPDVLYSYGSGILWKPDNLGGIAGQGLMGITNWHVAQNAYSALENDPNPSNAVLRLCSFMWSGNFGEAPKHKYAAYVAKPRGSLASYDFSIFSTGTPFSKDEKVSITSIPTLQKGSTAVCDGNNLKFGDQVYALGYPVSGGSTLTITEGIVSGFEGDFIKTSAKIDAGNSGGLAIHQSGCLLGIPTYVQTGPYETLGRILRFDRIVDKL